MFVVENTLLVATDWPNGMITPELAVWAVSIGLDLQTQFRTLCERGITVAYNKAVSLALQTKYDYFIFANNDIRPSPTLTQPFLEHDADIVCVECPEPHPAAWSSPSAFHAAMWRASRATLKKIGAPWFVRKYNKQGTKQVRCCCEEFRDKAVRCGFSVGHS